MQSVSRFCSALLVAALSLVSLSAQEGEVDGLILAEDVFPELDAILSEALEQSPRMIARNLQLLESEHEANVAKARQYPRVGGFSYFFFQVDDRVDREEILTGNKIYYDFRATQPVYHWGALKDGTRREQISAEISANNVLEAYRLLALSVRSEYVGLVVRNAVVKRAKSAYDRQQGRLEMMEVQVASGERPSSVLTSESLVLSERLVDLERAKLAFDTSLRSFRRLTGIADFAAERIPDELPALAVAEETEVIPLRQNYVEGGGVKETTRVKVVSLDLQREELLEKIQRRNLWPKIDVQAGVTQNEQSYTSNIGRKVGVASVFAGLRVTWNIFDSLATRENTLASKARQRRLEQKLRDLEQELQDEAIAAADSVRIFGLAMLNSDQRYTMQQSGKAFALENFERGLADQENVDNATYSEFVAQVNAYIGRSSYLNAVAEFLSTVDADPVVLKVAPRILNRQP